MLLFQNLIQNGIIYNESGHPVINIWSEINEGFLLIHFEDNGIGIEPRFFNRIFEHFKRLHTQDKYQGTGLGLSLCKKMAVSYGGDISVKSAHGEGSTFTIKLPHEMVYAESEIIPELSHISA